MKKNQAQRHIALRSVYFQGTSKASLAFTRPAALAQPGTVRTWDLSSYPDSAKQHVIAQDPRSLADALARETWRCGLFESQI